jgi:hypothetical protein
MILKIINNFFKSNYGFSDNFIKEDNYLEIILSFFNGHILLDALLNHFLTIKNVKVLNDLKNNINTYQLLDESYKRKMNDINFSISFNLIKNLIYFGANVNRDLLEFNFDYDKYNIINKTYKEINILENKSYNILKTIQHLESEIKYEEEKLQCYNIIQSAYYAQKINRFIKYYYNDKYRLTPFRLNLEKNKYLKIFLNKR